MSYNDLRNRIASSKTQISSLVSRGSEISRLLDSYVKDVEEFIKSNCKDQIARELNIYNSLKLRSYSDNFRGAALLTKKSINLTKGYSLAFDNMVDVVESDKK